MAYSLPIKSNHLPIVLAGFHILPVVTAQDIWPRMPPFLHSNQGMTLVTRGKKITLRR